MALDIRGINNALLTHAKSTGAISTTVGYEPKSAPGLTGITCGIWFSEMEPYPGGSGLDSTTAVLTMMARLYRGFITKPEGDIDIKLMEAAHVLITRLSSDFTLGGIVRNIDLLGEATSGGLRPEFGYVDLDNKKFRVVDITIPMIVNDVWDQEP